MPELEIIDRIVERGDEAVFGRRRQALPRFTYRDGYTFRVTDFGNAGVKVELLHEDEVSGAIILPLEQARQCARWLLRTISQEKDRLPPELTEIMVRLIRRKDLPGVLKRGEKKKLRQALTTLRELLGTG